MEHGSDLKDSDMAQIMEMVKGVKTYAGQQAQLIQSEFQAYVLDSSST